MQIAMHADGLFRRLIRSHCKAVAIKVSYVKKYNSEQKKDAPDTFCYPFWSSSVPLILADMYGEGCIGPVAA